SVHIATAFLSQRPNSRGCGVAKLLLAFATPNVLHLRFWLSRPSSPDPQAQDRDDRTDYALPPGLPLLANVTVDSPRLEVGRGDCGIIRNADHRIEEVRELVDLDRLRIGGKEHVF